MPASLTARTRTVRVHATNITGEGASQLVQSLLPAIEHACEDDSCTVHLPTEGPLANYGAVGSRTVLVPLMRYLPHAISRVLECTLFARQFKGEGPLLVLGDIPLWCRGPQTVFVQTTLLTHGVPLGRSVSTFKYRIARALFRLNARFAVAFIVQTEAMRRALSETYPDIAERIHIVAQPPPNWLLAARLKRTARAADPGSGLRLFYPAAPYPHKNHRLLARVNDRESHLWPVASLTLTVDETLHPNPKVAWMQCVGRLPPDDVLQVYAATDALLFLSLTESFGFPLVEAMWLGLPIICPDLPYSRFLCGSEAIYFDPGSITSLHAAITELDRRLRAGWWPDWNLAMKPIPGTWDAVAAAMLNIAAGKPGVTQAEQSA